MLSIHWKLFFPHVPARNRASSRAFSRKWPYADTHCLKRLRMVASTGASFSRFAAIGSFLSTVVLSTVTSSGRPVAG
jgi:hypothetical protein